MLFSATGWICPYLLQNCTKKCYFVNFVAALLLELRVSLLLELRVSLFLELRVYCSITNWYQIWPIPARWKMTLIFSFRHQYLLKIQKKSKVSLEFVSKRCYLKPVAGFGQILYHVVLKTIILSFWLDLGRFVPFCN